MTNSYPEKPFIAYKKTQVEMALVIKYLQAKGASSEVKRAAYIMFRNESANGKSGVNNNYAGIQADSGRWAARYDSDIVGVVSKIENGTGKVRLFCAFDNFTISLDFLLDRISKRGLFIGGSTYKIVQMKISNPTDLAIAYKREWVTGKSDYVPSVTELQGFLSMYNQAAKLFP